MGRTGNGTLTGDDALACVATDDGEFVLFDVWTKEVKVLDSFEFPSSGFHLLVEDREGFLGCCRTSENRKRDKETRVEENKR